jgi:hypothetical protein
MMAALERADPVQDTLVHGHFCPLRALNMAWQGRGRAVDSMEVGLRK